MTAVCLSNVETGWNTKRMWEIIIIVMPTKSLQVPTSSAKRMSSQYRWYHNWHSPRICRYYLNHQHIVIKPSKLAKTISSFPVSCSHMCSTNQINILNIKMIGYFFSSAPLTYISTHPGRMLGSVTTTAHGQVPQKPPQALLLLLLLLLLLQPLPVLKLNAGMWNVILQDTLQIRSSPVTSKINF